MSARTYPKLPLNYPLKTPPSLSSSFGTYRIKHHHAGLDLYGVEGTPVLAAADGYISIIKRGSSGYGRALYLKHKGGFVTLYGHMSAFAPRVEELIKRSKRGRERFQLKLRPRERLEFKAGELIGYLGSSGTDLMHLHFELRYKNTPVNPLTHGLTLPDSQAPTLIKLHATPFGEGSSIDGQAGPKSYPLAPRPARLAQPATAIAALYQQAEPRAEAKAEVDELAVSKIIVAPQETDSQSEPSDSSADELTIRVWGDVRLSLEVEDRIDGSARELSPYELILELDGRRAHHVRYDEGTYSAPRSSELDFDIERRGPERALVHRLYQYEERFKALKRSSRSPLKRLKRGEHSAKLIAVDAAGNRTEHGFKVIIERPAKPPCGLKKRRLTSVKRRHLREAKRLSHHELSWRPYGFTAPLSALGIADFECLEGRELQLDLRWNRERAPRSAARLVTLNGAPAISFDLRKLKFGPHKKGEEEPTKSQGDEPPLALDHSAQLWIGIKTFKGERHWSQLKLHEVRAERSFKSGARGQELRVEISADSPFQPYLTAMSAHQHSSEELEALKRAGFEPLSPLYSWAQGWLPMRKGNQITLPKRKGKRSGAYLEDHGRWWWVSSAWGPSEVTASSTHLSSFAALKDLAAPSISEPCWELKPPIGPRLILPISDLGSGIGKVTATLDGEPLLFELQRAWGRLLYRPQGAVKEGSHRLSVSVKDKAGHLSERSFKLQWPPPERRVCAQSDPLSLKP